MARIVVVFIFILIVFLPHTTFAQGEAAVPFLLFPTSAEGNGMGGIVGSVLTDDPMGVFSNPGQLGISSLDHHVLVGFYPSSTRFLQRLRGTNIRYSATAACAGVRLDRFLSLPFGMSLGAGYSTADFNLGMFYVTVDNPTPIDSFEAKEYTRNYTAGIGIDYTIRLAFGYTSKHITSNLAAPGVQGSGRPGNPSVTAYDLGVTADLPLIPAISRMTGLPLLLAEKVAPVVDITAAYVKRNLGDATVTYIDPAQADPLPREAMAGVGVRVGVAFDLPGVGSWDIASATVGREAEALLVKRAPWPDDPSSNAPPWEYLGGSGAIQWGKNLILGEAADRVTLRKGWAVNFGEAVIIRGGSARGGTIPAYTTSGVGLRLAGLLKLAGIVRPEFAALPFTGFLLGHIDLRYDHASWDYDDPSNLNNGISYDALSVIIR